MEPIFGFMLYAAAVAVVAVVASKRGLPGWTYAVGCIIGGPVVAMITNMAGGNGLAAAFAGFMVPVFALFSALSSETDEDKAASTGVSNGYKKCPQCAEPVRKEAIRCRNCGSELTTPVMEAR